jgi:hypothetical protein
MHINFRSMPAQTLRRALLANAIFSVICGSLMVFAEGSVSSWLGFNGSGILPIGAFLLVFAVYLVWMANQSSVPTHLVSGVIAGDWAWVLGSVLLLLLRSELFSWTGKLLIIDTAVVVAVFAILQRRGLSLASGSPAPGHG